MAQYLKESQFNHYLRTTVSSAQQLGRRGRSFTAIINHICLSFWQRPGSFGKRLPQRVANASQMKQLRHLTFREETAMEGYW
jgi:hypothetical protein